MNWKKCTDNMGLRHDSMQINEEGGWNMQLWVIKREPEMHDYMLRKPADLVCIM